MREYKSASEIKMILREKKGRYKDLVTEKERSSTHFGIFTQGKSEPMVFPYRHGLVTDICPIHMCQNDSIPSMSGQAVATIFPVGGSIDMVIDNFNKSAEAKKMNVVIMEIFRI